MWRELADFGFVRASEAFESKREDDSFYTVATLPAASEDNEGHFLYVRDGAAGSPCLAFSDGSNRKRADTLANVSGS